MILRKVLKIKGKSPTYSSVRYLFHGVFFTSYKTIICKQFFGNKFSQIGPAIIHGMCIAHNGNHDKCSTSWLIFDVAFKYFIAVLLLQGCPSITVYCSEKPCRLHAMYSAPTQFFSIGGFTHINDFIWILLFYPSPIKFQHIMGFQTWCLNVVIIIL
jgi:hypothetical protein